MADLDFGVNQAVQHNLIDENDADLRESLRQIRAVAEEDSTITIGDNVRPRSNKDIPVGNKRPSAVFRGWVAQPET